MNFKFKERNYINPYLGGTILGLVLFLSYILTGEGLGASGAASKIQAYLLSLVSANHVNNVGHLAGIVNTEHPLFNGQVIMFLGTFLGGMISGILNGRFKFEIRKGSKITNKQRLVYAFIGGAIMGYGARISRGCTSGQALSGGAVFSVGSWLFMFSVFGGGYLLAYFVRKIWQP